MFESVMLALIIIYKVLPLQKYVFILTSSSLFVLKIFLRTKNGYRIFAVTVFCYSAESVLINVFGLCCVVYNCKRYNLQVVLIELIWLFVCTTLGYILEA